MTEVLGTGLSGLVGSKVVDLLSNHFSFQNLDLSVGVDITNEQQVMDAVEKSSAESIIHMAAFTDVTKAYEQRDDVNGVCYKVNVVGTQNIARAAKAFGKHFIHLSTSYVFDGTKPTSYVENDAPNPIEWYGYTKAKAEEVVQHECDHFTIFRIDQPFRSDEFARPDTTHKLIGLLLKGGFKPFADHWFGPTIIEDFALVLDWAVKTKPQGIIHASSGEKVSDYEYASMINDALGLHAVFEKGSLAEYLKTLNRPYQQNTALNCEKLFRMETGIKFTPLFEALSRVQFSRPQ